MAQFLLVTTLLTIAGLIATMVMGFLSSPVHAAQHILFSLTTVVIGLFSQSMTMFFFIGTGKQLKDSVKGTPDEAPVRLSIRQLKSRVFPIATYATAVLMITFIMGGGVSTGKTPRWLHDVLAFLTLAMFMRAYWMQIHAMNANAELMEKYLSTSDKAPRPSATPNREP
jgi:hypothetical protein